MRPGVRLVLSVSALVMALANCSRTESQPSSSHAGVNASSSTGSSQALSRVPKRGHADCAGFLKRMADSAKAVKIAAWTEPGSWGGLSSDLQRVPAGVELCGATHLGEPKDKASPTSIWFRSPLYGDDLRKFWAPILTAAGCAFQEDDSDNSKTQFVWRCPHEKGGVVTILTDLRDEFYSIGFVKF